MRGNQGPERLVARPLAEQPVTGVARPFLQRGFGLLLPFDGQDAVRHAEGFAGRSDHLRLGPGFGPQAVIDRCSLDLPGPRRRGERQQGETVGSA